MIKIAPSILSADFSKLGDDILSISGADYLHFDVMDGVFVPNITIGIPVLQSIRKFTDMTIDVHLMITHPSRFVKNFCDSGADIVVFHMENETHEGILDAIKTVRECGKRVGIALRPGTPASAVMPYIGSLDMVLAMTVEPGFGGQKFKHEVMPKLRELRRVIDERGLDCELEVDGGVNPETGRICAENGANVLVAGSDVFKASDRNARIEEIRGMAE